MKRRDTTRPWLGRATTLAAIAIVVTVIAHQRHSQNFLQQENAMLRQQVDELQAFQNENPPLAALRQQIANSHSRDIEEINRLRAQVSELQQRTNQLATLRQFQGALERERWKREYLDLAAQFTGKPRVPRIGAWLGVGVGDVKPSAPNLAPTEGAIVHMVVPNGPAATAKIEPGDVIVSIDNAAVRDSVEFKALLAQRNGAQTITLGILREGTPLAINVNALDWPQ